jgi:hypothetical protein
LLASGTDFHGRLYGSPGGIDTSTSDTANLLVVNLHVINYKPGCESRKIL